MSLPDSTRRPMANDDTAVASDGESAPVGVANVPPNDEPQANALEGQLSMKCVLLMQTPTDYKPREHHLETNPKDWERCSKQWLRIKTDLMRDSDIVDNLNQAIELLRKVDRPSATQCLSRIAPGTETPSEPSTQVAQKAPPFRKIQLIRENDKRKLPLPYYATAAQKYRHGKDSFDDLEANEQKPKEYEYAQWVVGYKIINEGGESVNDNVHVAQNEDYVFAQALSDMMVKCSEIIYHHGCITDDCLREMVVQLITDAQSCRKQHVDAEQLDKLWCCKIEEFEKIIEELTGVGHFGGTTSLYRGLTSSACGAKCNEPPSRLSEGTKPLVMEHLEQILQRVQSDYNNRNDFLERCSRERMGKFAHEFAMLSCRAVSFLLHDWHMFGQHRRHAAWRGDSDFLEFVEVQEYHRLNVATGEIQSKIINLVFDFLLAMDSSDTITGEPAELDHARILQQATHNMQQHEDDDECVGFDLCRDAFERVGPDTSNASRPGWSLGDDERDAWYKFRDDECRNHPDDNFRNKHPSELEGVSRKAMFDWFCDRHGIDPKHPGGADEATVPWNFACYGMSLDELLEIFNRDEIDEHTFDLEFLWNVYTQLGENSYTEKCDDNDQYCPIGRVFGRYKPFELSTKWRAANLWLKCSGAIAILPTNMKPVLQSLLQFPMFELPDTSPPEKNGEKGLSIVQS